MSILEPGEVIVYKARIHRFCYVFPLLLLGLGLFITFPPETHSHPGSRLYQLEMQGAALLEDIKTYIPNRILPYVETFQIVRKNYVGLLLIVLGSIRLCYAFSHRNLSRYWITNRRIISQAFIFNPYLQDILLDRFARIRIHYSIFGKRIGRGRAVINDTGMQEIEIKHLDKPEKLRYAINTAIKLHNSDKTAGQIKREH